jgi:hypothetical protein
MNAAEYSGALKPWMRGPFELIRHADGHLKDNGDTDRRIALIGFDNAIEVSIDVFIRLHPRLRAGVEIKRDEVEQAQRNYHTKIEFLDKHVQARQIPLSIPVDEIVWFHQLRNELYHSGNGMVPEAHVISGARAAALAVFQALFGLDIGRLLGTPNTGPEHIVQRPAIQTQNPEMEFLGWFIELEQAIRQALPQGDARPMATRQMWQALLKQRPDLSDLTPDMEALTRHRNAVVHGHPVSNNDRDELNNQMESVLRVLDRMQTKVGQNKPTENK